MFPSAILAIRLLLTGCHENEVLTLERDNVDRTGGELPLSDGNTADSNTITIPHGFL